MIAALALALAASQANAALPFAQGTLKNAKADAHRRGRPLVVFVRARECADCETMFTDTFREPEARAWLEANAVAYEFDTLDGYMVKELAVREIPAVVVFDSDGREINRVYGKFGPDKVPDLLKPAGAPEPPPATAQKGKLRRGEAVTLELIDDRQVSGVYRERKDGAVWLELETGEMGVDAKTIRKIRREPNDAAEFVRRRNALKEEDAEGHFALARWAASKNLKAAAQAEAEYVLTVSTGHAGAHFMLGHVQLNDQWIVGDRAQELKDHGFQHKPY